MDKQDKIADLVNSPFAPQLKDGSDQAVDDILLHYIASKFNLEGYSEETLDFLFPLKGVLDIHLQNKSTENLSIIQSYICNIILFGEYTTEEARCNQLLDSHLRNIERHSINKSSLIYNKESERFLLENERTDIFNGTLNLIVQCLKQNLNSQRNQEIYKRFKDYKNALSTHLLTPYARYRNMIAHSNIRSKDDDELEIELHRKISILELKFFKSLFHRHYSEMYYTVLLSCDKYDIYDSLKHYFQIEPYRQEQDLSKYLDSNKTPKLTEAHSILEKQRIHLVESFK